MTARALLLLAALVVLVAGGPGTRAQEEARPETPARVAPAPPDVDLLGIRNIFRYADAPRVDRGPGPATTGPPAAEPAEASAPAPRAHLVGLVERAGRRAAALSVDGEVVVLGEGESAGGFTVLAVSDEAVRLRSPEGDEETLPLP